MKGTKILFGVFIFASFLVSFVLLAVEFLKSKIAENTVPGMAKFHRFFMAGD
jgi:hypothetical protein